MYRTSIMPNVAEFLGLEPDAARDIISINGEHRSHDVVVPVPLKVHDEIFGANVIVSAAIGDAERDDLTPAARARVDAVLSYVDRAVDVPAARTVVRSLGPDLGRIYLPYERGAEPGDDEPGEGDARLSSGPTRSPSPTAA